MSEEALHNTVTEGTSLPFGPLGMRRTPAELALFHAGIEFITPVWERDIVVLSARGYGMIWDIPKLAALAGKTEDEVEKAIGRVTRTLISWERRHFRYASKYVFLEPQSLASDGASERDQRNERGNRAGGV